ncbi:MAG: DUF4919 domain-containing protein [Crocinitomix sp.]|nr:DUF4919 domain-containing protein [Crocinitomix sp.]
MNRLLLLLILSVLAPSLFGQKISNVDFDAIKIEISDSSSIYYYPSLVKRFQKQDTTLSNVAFNYLYYGNVFQENYYPYGATDQQRLFVEAYKKNDSFAKTEELGLAVLNENPVNLDVLLKMVFLYNREKDVGKATIFAKLYVSFLEVIYASGTGEDCNNGFVVISVDDEYRITGDLGLTVVRQALVGSCDQLVFSRKGQKWKSRIKGLFFNVKMPLSYLAKSFQHSDDPLPDKNPDEDED